MGHEDERANHLAYLKEMAAFLKRRGKKLWTEELRDEDRAIWEKYYGPLPPLRETPTRKTPTTPHDNGNDGA
jgi:hypothetical protein